MASEGINFTRMYTEPSCTPRRAAVLTGRHPVLHGMGVVRLPHEFLGLCADEVTIAEVLSAADYATAFFGMGHLGDIQGQCCGRYSLLSMMTNLRSLSAGIMEHDIEGLTADNAPAKSAFLNTVGDSDEIAARGEELVVDSLLMKRNQTYGGENA